MSVHSLVFVALGGAVGALARYLTMLAVGHWLGQGFPWGTVAVNVIGSFVLGTLIEAFSLTWSPPESFRLFMVVGILGAFTTFSTFSLDVSVLMSRGSYLACGGYIAGSVILSIAALFAGMALSRQVLS